MGISQRAIVSLCDDLRRWRKRIQTAVANGSLDRNALAVEVDNAGESDRLLARLRMVENAGPLADAIQRELTEGWFLVTLNSTSPENGLALCRKFAAGVDRRVGDAQEAVEQLQVETPPGGNAVGGGPDEADGEQSLSAAVVATKQILRDWFESGRAKFWKQELARAMGSPFAKYVDAVLSVLIDDQLVLQEPDEAPPRVFQYALRAS